RDQWVNALTGQAFFAPIYFVLTYVTIRILGGIMDAANSSIGAVGGTTNQAALSAFGSLGTASVVGGTGTVAPGVFSTIFNFVVVIAFLIISLIISKQWADKAGGGVNKMTKWATGFAGGATFGLAGR